jgi:hypothetical protein
MSGSRRDRDPKPSAEPVVLDVRALPGWEHRLQTAKTRGTRATRIKAMVEAFERGERFYE